MVCIVLVSHEGGGSFTVNGLSNYFLVEINEQNLLFGVLVILFAGSS